MSEVDDGRAGGPVRPPDASHNELGGTVYGPSVQARTVHGGIHFSVQRPDTAVVPWQLPPGPPMIDRRRELAELHRLLRADGGPIVLLSGMPGVGKTTLALAWLRGLGEEFPDGRLYADLRGHGDGPPARWTEIVGGFLRGLGVPAGEVPPVPAEQLGLYRSLTAQRRLGVLLDDAATAAQVRPLLPAGPNVTVVTSRSRLSGLLVNGGVPVHLEPLERQAAVELLAATMNDHRVRQEPVQAGELVDLCARLPLAVQVAAARLAARPNRPITTMVRALADERGRLDALALDGDHTVRAALDVSYRDLPEAASLLYRGLGVHPGPDFGPVVAAALLGTGEGGDPDAAQLVLDVLVDRNLLTEAADGRYRFHDLIRLHAVAKMCDRPAPERADALRATLDHYLATATCAEVLLEPQHATLSRDYARADVPRVEFADRGAALAWLEQHRVTLSAAIRAAASARLPVLAWQLTDALWPLFLRGKYFDEARTAHEIGLRAARECADPAAESRMSTSGGLSELSAGNHDTALRMFTEASRVCVDSGDAVGAARTRNYTGLALLRLGRLDEAAEAFREAEARCLALGDDRPAALARFNRADVALRSGLPDRAVEYAEAARVELDRVGDEYNAARAQALIGRALSAWARHDEADAQLTAALEVLRGHRAPVEAAHVLSALAESAERRKRPDHARELYAEALELYGAVRTPAAEVVRARLRDLGPPG
ncbi:tetratricopeptide repeat protein [Embleya sp. NPDC005575]|uniref:ATP-binding protein n=1 Tax=Embleya sp. NPDC005575 TaxID=3156892 RepID=UPI0033B8F03E